MSPTGNILICDLLFGACCHIAKGLLPDSIAPLFTASKLIALPKGNGDVRPIAIGETVDGKNYLSAAEARFDVLLHSPSRWGSYTRRIRNAIPPHSMLLQSDPELGVLKTDISSRSIVSQDNNF